MSYLFSAFRPFSERDMTTLIYMAEGPEKNAALEEENALARGD
jgi:hypothetical protein